MLASILIPTYRRAHLLEQTLNSLTMLRRPHLLAEVLVIDNAQDARTQSVVRAAAARLPIRILVEPVPGKNRALNRAVPEARGDLLVFTDDDVVVDVDWLGELIDGAARWPDIAVFGGRILPRWPADAAPAFDQTFWAHAYAIADWGIEEGPYSAGRVFGPNMAIRRWVFARGWKFSPDLGPNGTDNYVVGGDTELTGRLERAGFPAVYLPRALVIHQIRPEQLRLPWLYRRAFRRGRWDVWSQPSGAGLRIARLPLTLWRDLAQSLLAYLRSRCHRDPVARFGYAIAYWHRRGMAYECRQARPWARRGRGGATAVPAHVAGAPESGLGVSGVDGV